MSNQTLAVTRVANSCVLLELNGHTILTDPWFTERWHLHRAEPLGMTVPELPPLTAIVASHPVPNHWDLRGLRQYPHKAESQVYVATARMARQARTAGFPTVKHLRWGEVRHITPELTVEAVPAGRALLFHNNAYLFKSNGMRVFFGGEISDVSLLERHQADVALLPVNGLKILGGPRLVTGPAQAVTGAKILRARVLIPIHDAHANDPLYFMIRRHGSGADAQALADDQPEVVNLPPGQRWETSSEG